MRLTDLSKRQTGAAVMPLIIFAAFAALLVYAIVKMNSGEYVPREVPTPLIGKPAPAFDLPLLLQQGNITDQDLKGEVTLVNVWASWCFACRQEHEVVKFLARQGIRIVGLNYKDENQDAIDWLGKLGNPYHKIAVDLEGRSAIDWGVYGAPETFLVDEQGIIRHKVIGPLTSLKVVDPLLAVASERGYTELAASLQVVRQKLVGE
jgi:cytochrome c biogenesis protein CcmG/thiol:disulfide interchange protein DsbE